MRALGIAALAAALLAGVGACQLIGGIGDISLADDGGVVTSDSPSDPPGSTNDAHPSDAPAPDVSLPSCPSGSPTTLSGTVLDPAKLRPVYDAVVYVPSAPVAPLPQGPSCDRCGAVPSGSPIAVAITAADGTFTLRDVPAGNVPLVIQVGKWRRQATIPNVTACQPNKIADDDLTRLPANQMEGDIPQFAVATSSFDAVECLLRRIGIADSEFTASNGNGRVHLYQGTQGATAGPSTQQADALWADPALLAKYDFVLGACQGGLGFLPPPSLQNIATYAAMGGRLLGTHFEFSWIADGPPPLPSAAVFAQNAPRPASPINASVVTSFPKGEAFAEWLATTGASTMKGTVSLLNARAEIVSTNPQSSAWLTIPAPPSVGYFSFDTPFGAGESMACGKMAIANWHVVGDNGGGVFPAECPAGPTTANVLAAEFLLFDVSACVQDDTMAPQPPPTK